MPDRREEYYQNCIKQAGPSYPDFDLLSSQITLGLAHTYDVLHQRTAQYMASFGLSKSTLNILMLLRHGPAEGMQLHELGELLLVSRANITGLIDHLEQKGYVKRVIDASDRRVRYARLTRKAETLLDEFVPLHFRNIRALTQDLTNNEKDMLLALLSKMRKSLSAHSDDCQMRPECLASA